MQCQLVTMLFQASNAFSIREALRELLASGNLSHCRAYLSNAKYDIYNKGINSNTSPAAVRGSVMLWPTVRYCCLQGDFSLRKA